MYSVHGSSILTGLILFSELDKYKQDFALGYPTVCVAYRNVNFLSNLVGKHTIKFIMSKLGIKML